MRKKYAGRLEWPISKSPARVSISGPWRTPMSLEEFLPRKHSGGGGGGTIPSESDFQGRAFRSQLLEKIFQKATIEEGSDSISSEETTTPQGTINPSLILFKKQTVISSWIPVMKASKSSTA